MLSPWRPSSWPTAFVTSQYGKNCIAVSQDAVAAQMMGVNILKTKLIALFISAFYAGVAGGLLGFYMAYLTPSLFNITRSSDLLAAVVFGGMQSMIGPVIAAFVLVAVPQLLYSFTEWRLVVYGLLFVVVMVFRPQGLLGYTEMNFTFLRAWMRRSARRISGRKLAPAGTGISRMTDANPSLARSVRPVWRRARRQRCQPVPARRAGRA